MNKSKKIIIGLIGLGLSYSSSLYAFNDTHTVYVGAIYGKIKNNTAHGALINYRYEPEKHWGLLISLLNVKSNHKEDYSVSSSIYTSKLQQKNNVYALLVGPTYRITPLFSVYTQMGPMKLKYQENIYHPHMNVTDRHKIDTTSVIVHAGIDYNPIQNIALSLGYLYSNVTVSKRHIELSGLQLSLGYRF